MVTARTASKTIVEDAFNWHLHWFQDKCPSAICLKDDPFVRKYFWETSLNLFDVGKYRILIAFQWWTWMSIYKSIAKWYDRLKLHSNHWGKTYITAFIYNTRKSFECSRWYLFRTAIFMLQYTVLPTTIASCHYKRTPIVIYWVGPIMVT